MINSFSFFGSLFLLLFFQDDSADYRDFLEQTIVGVKGNEENRFPKKDTSLEQISYMFEIIQRVLGQIFPRYGQEKSRHVIALGYRK